MQFAIELRLISIMRLIVTLCETGPYVQWTLPLVEFFETNEIASTKTFWRMRDKKTIGKKEEKGVCIDLWLRWLFDVCEFNLGKADCSMTQNE